MLETPTCLTLRDGMKVRKTGNANFWQCQHDEINDNGKWHWMDTWNLNQNCLPMPSLHNNMDMDTGLLTLSDAEMWNRAGNLQQHMLC